MSVNGKVIVITGASSGLGAHFAAMLGADGASVALCARRLPKLQEYVDAIVARGGRAIAVPLDVTNTESCNAVFEKVAADLGVPEVLINNSGLAVTRPLIEQSDEDWDAVLETNLKGAFRMTRSFAQHWKQSGKGGAIINVASVLGLRQAGAVGPYAVSKAGLVQLTKIAALELARYAIRVNAIAPGYIETDMNRAQWSTPAGEAMIRRIPQRRLGQPEDLDGVMRLLASDDSAYMTGVVIPVDGGHLVNTL